MPNQIIEGLWDELVTRDDPRGRRVRVFVLEDTPELPQESREEWVRRFREWADSHGPVGHFVDDSRESIYGGTVDDPR